jgi:hypothetical protein
MQRSGKDWKWTNKAQSNDGGWGAGTHARQDVMDPHAVPSDPATTSMVAMSLLRTDNTLQKGEYSKNLEKATEFLLKAQKNARIASLTSPHLPTHNQQIKLEEILM